MWPDAAEQKQSTWRLESTRSSPAREFHFTASVGSFSTELPEKKSELRLTNTVQRMETNHVTGYNNMSHRCIIQFLMYHSVSEWYIWPSLKNSEGGFKTFLFVYIWMKKYCICCRYKTTCWFSWSTDIFQAKSVKTAINYLILDSQSWEFFCFSLFYIKNYVKKPSWTVSHNKWRIKK